MTSRTAANLAENRRIDSWKEIAAFFGRDERTVKRWEKDRGLPVHRLPGERGGVFAWSHELTAWLNSSRTNGKSNSASPAPQDPPPPSTEAGPDPPAAIPALGAAEAPPKSHVVLRGTILAAVLLLSLLVGLDLLHRHRQQRAALAETASSAHHHVPDPEAQEFYLKGRYYWSRRTDASLRQALDAFTQAVVHDSNYAQAYAGLAECYDLMPEFTSMPESEAFPRAIAAARKAISLDDSLSEAHRALGFALFFWDWKVPAALGEYQRALALNPRDEEAHHWYASTLLTLGRYQEASVEIAKARQLNPASRSILCDEALIRYWAGDHASAIVKLREIEQAEPDFVSAPRYLAGLAFEQKDYRTFIDQTRHLAALSGDKELNDVADAAQHGLARGGVHAMLEAIRIVQLRYFEAGKESGVELARTCAFLGRKQDAVNYLKAAVASHDHMVLTVTSNPDFASLNGDPAFEQLRRQLTERMYRA
ncbi:MAG: tetratricopeptide repeat protein [Acidobacteriota bacterium]